VITLSAKRKNLLGFFKPDPDMQGIIIVYLKVSAISNNRELVFFDNGVSRWRLPAASATRREIPP
jgi:hypothetical protein